jgi:hypothetical protein
MKSKLWRNVPSNLQTSSWGSWLQKIRRHPRWPLGLFWFTKSCSEQNLLLSTVHTETEARANASHTFSSSSQVLAKPSLAPDLRKAIPVPPNTPPTPPIPPDIYLISFQGSCSQTQQVHTDIHTPKGSKHHIKIHPHTNSSFTRITSFVLTSGQV